MLTSILQQGAEFNSLADTALGDRYNRMLDLITTKTPEGDFPIMMALVNSTPPESMVRIYNQLMQCLNNIGGNLKVFTNNVKISISFYSHRMSWLKRWCYYLTTRMNWHSFSSEYSKLRFVCITSAWVNECQDPSFICSLSISVTNMKGLWCSSTVWLLSTQT